MKKNSVAFQVAMIQFGDEKNLETAKLGRSSKTWKFRVKFSSSQKGHFVADCPGGFLEDFPQKKLALAGGFNPIEKY